jgi:hypothetical protein
MLMNRNTTIELNVSISQFAECGFLVEAKEVRGCLHLGLIINSSSSIVSMQDAMMALNTQPIGIAINSAENTNQRQQFVAS